MHLVFVVSQSSDAWQEEEMQALLETQEPALLPLHARPMALRGRRGGRMEGMTDVTEAQLLNSGSSTLDDLEYYGLHIA